jgi:hypothetical protein
VVYVLTLAKRDISEGVTVGFEAAAIELPIGPDVRASSISSSPSVCSDERLAVVRLLMSTKISMEW